MQISQKYSITGLLATKGLTRFLTSCLFVALLCPALLRGQSDADDVKGHWEGVVGDPFFQGVVLDLSNASQKWDGTFEVPIWGYQPMAIEHIRIDKDVIEFAIPKMRQSCFAHLERDGKRLLGYLDIDGVRHLLWVGRDKVPVARPPSRPQTPIPPFPYSEEEVSLRVGHIVLAGTLTVPSGTGPFPAVVLLPGSRGADRDYSWYCHRSFAVVADFLTRQDVIVLRCDSRGFGKSTGEYQDATLDDLASDTSAMLDLLTRDGRVDKARIGLLGHSQGGLVALKTSEKSQKMSFVILLSCPAGPIKETIIKIKQNELRHRETPQADKWAEAYGDLLSLSMSLANGRERDADSGINQIVQGQASLVGKYGKLPVITWMQTNLHTLMTPNAQSLLQCDPEAMFRNTPCRIFAMQAEFDSQIDCLDNIKRLQKCAERSRSEHFKVLKLEGVNHNFQDTNSSDVHGALIEQTISPRALYVIRDVVLRSDILQGCGNPR